MKLILSLGLLLAFSCPTAALAQGACPPDEDEPRRMVNQIALEPAFQIVLDDAGITSLRPEDIRVLSPKSDGRACGLLNARIKRHHDAARHPRARWTFYEARDRYIVIYWIAPAPEGAPPSVNFSHPEKGWIFGRDLKELTSFML